MDGTLTGGMSVKTEPVYRVLAATVDALKRCDSTGNVEWFAKHTASINQIVADLLPSGSGWDNGTAIDLDRSSAERLVFTGSYHHMNDGGMYDGWTEHTVTVRASLVSGFELAVSGRNRNDVKEYLADLFHTALAEPIGYDTTAGRYRDARSFK